MDKTIYVDYRRKWYHFQNGTKKYPFQSFTKAAVVGDCKMVCPDRGRVYFYRDSVWIGEGGGYKTNDPDHFRLRKIEASAVLSCSACG